MVAMLILCTDLVYKSHVHMFCTCYVHRVNVQMRSPLQLSSILCRFPTYRSCAYIFVYISTYLRTYVHSYNTMCTDLRTVCTDLCMCIYCMYRSVYISTYVCTYVHIMYILYVQICVHIMYILNVQIFV